jgi:cutinase
LTTYIFRQLSATLTFVDIRIPLFGSIIIFKIAIMKNVFQSLLPLSLLLAPTFALPTAANEPSFAITEVEGTGLTVKEYAAQLASGSPALAKRQYNGDTFNQLTDGSACRDVSLIFARGTTSPGNVGEAGSEGPTFFNAVASRVGAARLAVQGVNYSASILGFLSGGDAAGGTTMFNLINDVSLSCNHL